MTLEEYMDTYYRGWRRLETRDEFLEKFNLTEDEIRYEYKNLKKRDLKMLEEWKK